MLNDSNDIKLNLEDMGDPSFNMPEAKIALAKKILIALFILVLLTYLPNFIPDEWINPRAVKFSETIYDGIVPIASMIIGYYFAKD